MSSSCHHHQTWIPRLPAELTDRIIDYLYDDPLALTICSLVCRVWVPSSRFHLFHRIEIGMAVYDRTLQFCELLEQSPAIGRYVKELSVTHPTLDEIELLWDIIPRLGNVRFFSYQSNISLPPMADVLSAMGPVTHLDIVIYPNTPTAIPDLTDYLREFRSVTHLSVHDLDFLSRDRVGQEEFADVLSTLCLKRLDVGGSMIPAVSGALNSRPPKELCALHMEPVFSSQWSALSAIISAVSGSLKEIAVSLSHGIHMPLESIYDSSAWPAAVQSCHSLERMFLSSSSNNFHLLVHIVAKARVCFVKDLEIQLHVKECQEQLQDFDTLARLLKNPEQFPRLASVHVTIEVDEDSSTLRATLTDMLASLKCRRGLSLTCTMLPPDHCMMPMFSKYRHTS